MKVFWPDKREGRVGAVPGEPNWPTIKINIGSNNGGGPLQCAAQILINFHFDSCMWLRVYFIEQGS